MVTALRRRRSARWVLDAFVLVVLYKAYGVIQGLVPAHRSVAEANARRLSALEGQLRLDPEHALNHLVAGHAWLAQICDYWYTWLHFPVAISIALWLTWRHHDESRRLMTALYAATALALAGFWLFPLAPPRLMAGGHFVDTVVRFDTWGGWHSGPVDALANQYAALPSLHMAWSIWCAVALSRCASSRLLRGAAFLYPAATLFVILGTGNHYLLDAVAGALVLLVGFVVARALASPIAVRALVAATGRRAPRPRRRSLSAPPEDPARVGHWGSAAVIDDGQERLVSDLHR